MASTLPDFNSKIRLFTLDNNWKSASLISVDANSAWVEPSWAPTFNPSKSEKSVYLSTSSALTKIPWLAV